MRIVSSSNKYGSVTEIGVARSLVLKKRLANYEASVYILSRCERPM